MDMVPPDSITTLPETDSFSVQLKKDTHGLGITIAGYVCEKGMYCFFIILIVFVILFSYSFFF